jgi:putative N6-adenine-specific DNA methylase
LPRVSVSRAGGKLRAALDRFGLGDAVRGARALDVGASTGGFTEALLAGGALAVTAIDVGHGQLHPSLREDSRVTSLEGTDFRRVSLDVAEGPFDFFAVDVSFVAARNMLRPLAFRLRPGAQGVLLIKPQFELPDSQVVGGDVADPNLRRQAVERVRARAEALGFTLVEIDDSPVAGSSGTVEILAHLRFGGRPATLPARGERRPAKPKRTRAAPAADEPLRWFAIVAPGLEEVARREVAALPDATEVTALAGGVEWTGRPASGARANLWLRIATRVVARVGAVEAREFGKLRRRAAGLPWARFVAPGSKLSVRASATRSRLYHTGALAETAALAIADAVPGARTATDDEVPDVEILVRGAEDVFTFSVDASGERLHRRGARVEVGAAPLRETLAAGILALAGWTPDTALVDPMCGAGTIVLEAGAQALDQAPGLARPFAVERWPMFETDAGATTIATLRADAEVRVRAAAARAGSSPPVAIVGSDRDPRALESARNNAARAGLERFVTLACRDLGDVRPPAATGLVVANPPYGRRLGDPRAAARVYRDLGRALRAHFSGWRAAVLVPGRLDADRALGLRVSERFALRNGGLPVTLAIVNVG